MTETNAWFRDSDSDDEIHRKNDQPAPSNFRVKRAFSKALLILLLGFVMSAFFWSVLIQPLRDQIDFLSLQVEAFARANNEGRIQMQQTIIQHIIDVNSMAAAATIRQQMEATATLAAMQQQMTGMEGQMQVLKRYSILQENKTALFYAAIENEDKDIINVLLENEEVKSLMVDDRAFTDPKWYELSYDAPYGTSLHWASMEGHAVVVEALLENGANVSAVDNSGFTPLHRAAMRGHAVVIGSLVAGGASVSSMGHQPWTPLHVAAAYGKVDAIITLLDYGASVSEKDPVGITPLHLAAEVGQVDAIIALLDHGANASEVMEKVDFHTPLHRASIQGQSDAVRVLLANDGVDVNRADAEGYTALLLATESESYDTVVELLTKEGLDLGKMNHDGKTALQMAIGQGSVDIATLLLRAEVAKEAGVDNDCNDAATATAASTV